MTKSVLILISLLIGGIYLSAGTPINEQVAVSGMADSLSAELPLPAIPDSLRTPRKRAAYLLAHFWDSMSFADTLRSRNPGFMEQNLVNYLSLFPHRSRAPANAARRSRQTRLPATGRTGREVPLYHRFAHAERGALHPLSGSHRPHPPAE